MKPITKDFFPFNKRKGHNREIFDQAGFSDEKYAMSPYRKIKLKG